MVVPPLAIAVCTSESLAKSLKRKAHFTSTLDLYIVLLSSYQTVYLLHFPPCHQPGGRSSAQTQNHDAYPEPRSWWKRSAMFLSYMVYCPKYMVYLLSALIAFLPYCTVARQTGGWVSWYASKSTSRPTLSNCSTYTTSMHKMAHGTHGVQSKEFISGTPQGDARL